MSDAVSIFNPASPGAESIRTLSLLTFAISAFLFLLVEGILIYCFLRFRSKGGATEPPQVYGSKPIELAWTAAPALVVFVLVLVGARSLWEVKVAPPKPEVGDNALFVTVIGRQWWWEYEYQSYNGRGLSFTTANELHVPVGDAHVDRPVYLTLESADVCHSFWIPRLGGKTDLIPGRTNTMWFRTSEAGVYLGQCAEYCGTQHAGMLLRVVAEPVGEFEQWLADQEKPAVDDPAVAEGKATFLSQACINCHRVRGTRAKGSYAPDLTHFASRQTLASGILPNTRENLIQWIHDPQSLKPGCLMPAFGLDAHDRDRIAEYLGSLR